MPPPVSYLDITPLPYSRVITQAEFNGGTFGALVNQVWFRFVTASSVALGLHANTGGTVHLQLQIFASNGTTLIQGSSTRAWWHPLDAGTYYVKCSNVSGGASDFDFTVDFSTVPRNEPIPTTPHLVINDDTNISFGTTSRPAAVIDTTTGEVIGFVDAIPNGESGSVLPTGISLWSDRFSVSGSQLVLLDEALGTIAALTPTQPFADGPNTSLPIITSDGTKFYVVDPDTGKVHTVAADGTFTQNVADLGEAVDYGAGVSRDGTILYYAPGTDVIKRWNLSLDVALSDLATIAGADWIAFTDQNNNHGEMLVMADGTIATNYKDLGTTHIVHIASSGSIINDWSFSSSTHAINHLAYVDFEGDSTGIYVWLFDVSSFGDFGTLNRFDLTTGTFTSIVTTDLFSAGINLKMQGGAETDQAFGPSNSCAMLSMSGAAVVEPPPPPPTPSSTPPPVPPECCESTAGSSPLPDDTIFSGSMWIPQCGFGGSVPSAADLSNSEDWDPQ